MSDGRVPDARIGDGIAGDETSSVDELLDRAVAAINRGDRVTANSLAQQVLTADKGNVDAEDLLATSDEPGEIRRLTILVADLVDSTVLSGRVEPETYRLLVGRYRQQVQSIVHRFEGYISGRQGDGLLAVFGYPIAHEDDVRRAVHAGLEIIHQVARLSEQAQRRFGIGVSVRVGVHRGLVYLDSAEGDVYGLGANVAARVSSLAPPGSVVVSDAVAPLVRASFELEGRPATAAKGVEGPIVHHQVLGERVEPVRVGRGPLVGRDREMAFLQKSWASALTGALNLPGVVFRGEPGIGKSRLAAAAAELADSSGAVVLELVGSPFHTDAGLHPVRTLLERRCGIGRLTDQAERLRLLDAEIVSCSLDPGSLVPLLAPVLGVGAEHGYQPVAAQGRKLYELIAQAVHSYLLACLGNRMGLVVAEDAHWYDPSTLEVLGSLLRAAQGPLLVLITGRPGSWLPEGWPVKVFDLVPLTDEQSDALVAALAPTLTAAARAVVVGRCDGLPFYIEQVVDDFSQTGVPEALYEPLYARLRATAKVVPVVEAAAVIGRQMDRGLLCSVVDLGEDELDEVIAELEAASVLEPWGTDVWRFRHELLREVAAELAPPSVRRGLHARVADALSRAAGGEPDWRLVAGHYERAERFDEAAAAYQQASAAARRRGALAEARTYLSLTLAQLDRSPPGPDRDRREMAARLERGFLATAGEGAPSSESAADFERCLRLGRTDLRDDDVFATLTALAGYYAIRADLRRTVQVLESLRAGLEQGRPLFRPVIEARFGAVTWLRGEFDAAAAYLEAATAGMAAMDQQQIETLWFQPNDPAVTAYVYLALLAMVRGDLTGAAEDLTKAAYRAEQLGFPQGQYSDAYTRFANIWLCIEADRLERAEVFVAELTEQAERHGFDLWRLVGATAQVTVEALAALSATAHVDPHALPPHIAAVTTLVDTLHKLELNVYITFFDGVLGRLLIAAGHFDSARARLDSALQLAEDTGMHFYDAELMRLRARTHTEPPMRQADLSAALELARRQGATLFELRAALDDFEFRGRSASPGVVDAISRFPAGSAFPEVARAEEIPR